MWIEYGCRFVGHEAYYVSIFNRKGIKYKLRSKSGIVKNVDVYENGRLNVFTNRGSFTIGAHLKNKPYYINAGGPEILFCNQNAKVVREEYNGVSTKKFSVTFYMKHRLPNGQVESGQLEVVPLKPEFQ